MSLQSHQIEKTEDDVRQIVLMNAVKMLTARGILKEENLKKNISVILSQQSDNFIYKVKPEIDNHPQILVKLYNTKISSINKSSNINEFLIKNGEFHKIIVAKDINENNIKNIKSTFPRTEIFLENFLMINLLDNILVPKYEIIAHDTDLYKSFFVDYNCKKKDMPRMFINDPVALYFNLKKNDIVRVVRPSESTGETPFYRCSCVGFLLRGDENYFSVFFFASSNIHIYSILM